MGRSVPLSYGPLGTATMTFPGRSWKSDAFPGSASRRGDSDAAHPDPDRAETAPQARAAGLANPVRSADALLKPADIAHTAEDIMAMTRRVVPFAEFGRQDVGRVGGKNASLGEMTAHLAAAGVRVPPGFATTADAYAELLDSHGLRAGIAAQIERLHTGAVLDEVGAAIRSMIMAEPLPAGLRAELVSTYEQLARDQGRDDPEVAVRSSATAEDLPQASFAGQQETYLNVRGPAQLLQSCHRCYASLFTDRAIDYRERMGFDHLSVALSVGVQIMVRSDLAGAGVIFTLDPESGFPEVIVVSAAWGLGETVVSGQVDPDEYTVFKPSLKDPALDPVIDVRIGAKRKKAVYGQHGLTRTADTTCEERSRRVLADAGSPTAGRMGDDCRRTLRMPHGPGMGQGRPDWRTGDRPGPPRNSAVPPPYDDATPMPPDRHPAAEPH